MLYEVAFLNPDNTPGAVRIDSATTIAHAERRALKLANMQRCDTVVVEEGTNKIVATVRYYRPNISVI